MYFTSLNIVHTKHPKIFHEIFNSEFQSNKASMPLSAVSIRIFSNGIFASTYDIQAYSPAWQYCCKISATFYCQHYCGWLMPSAIHVFSLHFLLRPKHVPAHAEFWEVRCFRVETPVDQENWALEIARSRIYKSLLHAQRLI